ncbi:mechanosensitive ion channel [Lysobacter arenosi]|uniref:Small-conductance mechanosensitive channel n=1 Tax=Lysobacter arenosi TaxID=2795387 RepID=A0ABX7RCS4_9GAMM|nr:mechanosensitive ion channel domain-containing protein [Lysobacter arenosi]QSX75952.1 mechanosensitive ion channel [Lysobacter arenosi]
MTLEQLANQLQRADDWTDVAVEWGVRLGAALLALYIGIQVAKWLARAVSRALTRAHVEPTAQQFLSRVTYVLILMVFVLAILQICLKVSPASLFAVLGAAGLAIGLAMKDSLSNVASGVMLVTLKPFRVGDIVDIGGKSGKVESVSIFQTKLRGADNQTIVLPNSLITTAPIINLTPDTARRIELIVGIGYNDSIEAARAAVLAIMHADKRIHAEPAPDVVVYELADSAVKLGIRCHVSNADHFSTKCDLNERIKAAFDRDGISIPYPQRDVRMYHHVAQDQGVKVVVTPTPAKPE